MGKFYAHLLYSESVEWEVLGVIRITHEHTTSSSRIFIKILLQELAENLGLEGLSDKLNNPLILPFT